jgi:hypothetical protein
LVGSVAGLAFILSSLGAVAAHAESANGTPRPEPSSSSALPVAPAAQSTYEGTVTAFLASHPTPAPLTSSASAEQLAENHAEWFTFLQQVPWTAMFGQWGCTVSDVHVTMSVDGKGETNPSVTDVSFCGGLEAVGPMPLTLKTRSAVLAEPGNASLRTLFADPAASATPLADSSSCGHSGSTYDCIVWNYSNGLIGATTEWEGGSSIYGHVRLGNVGSGSCGLGTFMLNAPDATIPPGGQSQALETGYYYNSYFSSRFYNPNFAGGYCASN